MVNQQVAKGLLERWGCVVTVVANGIEALDALEASPFDLVLMDVQMPEMDGLEATRRIRRRAGGEDVPIIGLTESQDPAFDRRAQAAGGRGDVAERERRRAVEGEVGRVVIAINICVGIAINICIGIAINITHCNCLTVIRTQ